MKLERGDAVSFVSLQLMISNVPDLGAIAPAAVAH
jgi:hypothetical protein